MNYIGNFLHSLGSTKLTGRRSGGVCSMDGRYWVWLAARLLVAVVIVGWAFSYLTPGGSGEKEFQKTLNAMKQVRSVRTASVADPTPTQHSEMSWELSCAQDAYHYRWDTVESDPKNPAEASQEEVHVGSTVYEHKKDDSWQAHQFSAGVKAAGSMCAKLADGTETEILPDIATMIRRGILEKGDKKTVNGVRCREWKVTMRGGFSGLEHDTLCLGLDDYLPYEMTVDWQHSRTTYSDYNVPFQLELPGPALQPASANSTN